MAAEYIRFMRSMQPHGPYYLGGYCYGGVVAFEMARQLEQAGERTALLAIFEGYAIGRRATLRKHWRPKVMLSFLRNLPYWLRDNLHPDGPYAHLLPWEQVQRLQQLGREPARLDCPLRCPSASGDFADRRRQLEAAHDLAMTHYRPGPYAGRLTLFRVQAMSLFRAHDPTMGWGEWAQQGVDVRMTPGTHYNILERPHVAGLAAQLRQCLQAAQANE
jgi:thioesterase domain-containing protein